MWGCCAGPILLAHTARWEQESILSWTAAGLLDLEWPSTNFVWLHLKPQEQHGQRDSAGSLPELCQSLRSQAAMPSALMHCQGASLATPSQQVAAADSAAGCTRVSRGPLP